jgi:lysophospholipase L1-like esterase
MNLAATIVLAPLLALQGRHVRRVTPRLPEAAGPRRGVAGAAMTSPCIRLLVVGDSAAAGVGVDEQTQALAMPLAEALADRFEVSIAWQLIAKTGYHAMDAANALRHASTLAPADILLTVLGVNDVAAMTSADRWLRALDDVHAVAVERCGVRMTWHAPLPPMNRLSLLPQPLRWTMGRHALRLNRALSAHVATRPDRCVAPVPPIPAGLLTEGWVAADGFHPGPLGYRAWVKSLSEGLAIAVPRDGLP